MKLRASDSFALGTLLLLIGILLILKGLGLAEDKVIPPTPQQPLYRLRNQKESACTVKIEPGPNFICEGYSLDKMTCHGEVITFKDECVEIHIEKREDKPDVK
jgi:hypothetical protein